MKRILIATDFSPAARNATDYALGLAAEFNAGVTLMTAYEEVPIIVPDAMVGLNVMDWPAMAKRRLEQEVDNLMTEKPPPIDILIWEGTASRAILEAAEQTGADLIIAGITGEGTGSRKVFGSTTTGLARKTNIPLLVVPETCRFEKPAGIGLAEDILVEKDQQTPKPVVELLEKFNAILYLVRIFNKESGEVVEILHQSANLRRKIGAFTPLAKMSFHKNIAKTLEEFAETYPVQMLVLLPHPKSLAWQWINGSTTRDMIFEASIPLLIVPDAHND